MLMSSLTYFCRMSLTCSGITPTISFERELGKHSYFKGAVKHLSSPIMFAVYADSPQFLRGVGNNSA